MGFKLKFRLSFVAILLLFSLASACTPQVPPANTKTQAIAKSQNTYIARCDKNCKELENEIDSAGGHIRARYANLDILAFEMPADKSTSVSTLSRFPIFKDKTVAPPSPVKDASVNITFSDKAIVTAFSPRALAASKPSNYLFNNRLTGAARAHKNNILGTDVIVAVIDSGTANNSEIVPILADTVIGGENFVFEDNEPSATSTLNDDHGTWVGSMIAGHGVVVSNVDSEFVQSVSTHAPNSVFQTNETEVEIPMTGTAPAAKIYALKTFGVNELGAPTSRIIAAMDRVLTLKTNFNNGMPSEPIAGDGSEENPFVFDSLNIKVVNLSLGGPALFPGQEIEDLISTALLDAGVVVIASAGNEGFAAMTGGSPGTGLGSLSVGATNNATHERILRDMRIGAGVGKDYRPTTHLQIAHFSSRGPTADGRQGVDIVANGLGVFVQSAGGEPALVSGTSFSAPTVAGAAALLWQAFPDSSASDIKVALVRGATKENLKYSTTKFDTGFGVLNIPNSLEALEEKELQDPFPKNTLAEANTKVVDNIQNSNITVLKEDQRQITETVSLGPGEVKQYFIETNNNTAEIEVEIERFRTELPTSQQNLLFGDGLAITVLDAPYSFDDTLAQDLLYADTEFSIVNPQPGLVRVAIMGDWTNKGNVMAQISIENEGILTPPTPTIINTISDGEVHPFQFDVAPQTTLLNFHLNWRSSWAFYPSHDLDLVITDPDGNLIFDAATLASPEMLTIETPIPGIWTVNVEGFSLHSSTDTFGLIVSDQNNIPLVTIN